MDYPLATAQPGKFRFTTPLILVLLILGSFWLTTSARASESAARASPGNQAEAPPGVQRINREGLIVDFSANAAADPKRTKLFEDEHIELNFNIRDAAKGAPLQTLYPGVWVDLGKAWNAKDEDAMSCKERVGLYLSGSVGIRPLIDLNSYYVLVLNKDPSISVIDPLVGMTGVTQLYTQVILSRPGADWVTSPDQKRLFVTMPLADQVAVIDTNTFKVVRNIDAGDVPNRIVYQPDAKYLWVGSGKRGNQPSNVTVIDTDTLEVAAEIPVGSGHHEISFSDDSRRAFVTSRNSGTVSVIDIQTLTKVKELATGPQPISLRFSALSQALYVADGQSGHLSVIDVDSLKETQRITLEPGLGPIQFSLDGRWGMLVNTAEDLVYVLDASTNELLHRIPVEGRPYQLAISEHFAYVRTLDSERVSLINLLQLENGSLPPVVKFQVGEKAPGNVKQISISAGMSQPPGQAAMLVVSPADNIIYYYMEGMNAPMGSFRNYGHRPVAVTVVDRTMKEKSPGLYSAQVQLPAPGTYELAFLLDSPQLLHCFSLEVHPNPTLQAEKDQLVIEYHTKGRTAKVGEPIKIRFRLSTSRSLQVKDQFNQLSVLYYRVPGTDRTQVPVRNLGGGDYEVELTLPKQGAYYLYIGSPEEGLSYGDLSYRTLIVTGARDKLATIRVKQ